MAPSFSEGPSGLAEKPMSVSRYWCDCAAERAQWNSSWQPRSRSSRSRRRSLSCRVFLDASLASFAFSSSKLSPKVSRTPLIPFQNLTLFGIFCFKWPSLIYMCACYSSRLKSCNPRGFACGLLSALSWSAWTCGCRNPSIWETSEFCAKPNRQRGSFRASNCWALCRSTCPLYCRHSQASESWPLSRCPVTRRSFGSVLGGFDRTLSVQCCSPRPGPRAPAESSAALHCWSYYWGKLPQLGSCSCCSASVSGRRLAPLRFLPSASGVRPCSSVLSAITVWQNSQLLIWELAYSCRAFSREFICICFSCWP